jgi:integrase
MQRYQLSLEKAKILRQRFIDGEYHSYLLAKELRISTITTWRYKREFEKIRAEYPNRLKDFGFYPSEPKRAHWSTPKYSQFLLIIPALIAEEKTPLLELKKRGFIIESPLKDIKPPRPNYDDFRKLENNDINKIYSAIVRCSTNALMSRRDTMMISILLFCGLRKGELIALRVNDLDLIKNEITVRAETSKSKKTRVLTMHPTLVLHVKDYLKARKNLKTEYLIVALKGDNGLTPHGLKHWVKSLIVKSGVKFHLHQFRHTFACKLCEANVNVFKVQKMMGHIDVAMTMRYARSMRTEDMIDDIGKISI